MLKKIEAQAKKWFPKKNVYLGVKQNLRRNIRRKILNNKIVVTSKIDIELLKFYS